MFIVIREKRHLFLRKKTHLLVLIMMKKHWYSQENKAEMQVRATPQMYFFAEVVLGRRPSTGKLLKLPVPETKLKKKEKKRKEGAMS